MGIQTSAGSALAMCAAAPATFDSTGYAALSWTNVGEITNLGEFGREYQVVTHEPLATRSVQKRKGNYNEGALAVQLALDKLNAGQVMLEAATNSDTVYSFKVTLQNGDKYYFQGTPTSFKKNVGSSNQMTGATSNIEVTSNSAGVGIIEVLAP